MAISYEKQVKEIILKEKWLMDILRTVRSLGLPDWYLAAGVIRNTVWDVLHGYTKRTPLNDIDLVYFEEKDTVDVKRIEKELQKKYPQYTFEVVNQAHTHEWYPYKKKAKNTSDGISQFIETPTCIGVRLEKNNTLTITAPHGLKDLFNLQVSPSSQQKEVLAYYRKRMKEKQWKKKWPKLLIS